MVRLARRLLSLVCWGACVIVTVFVVSFSPAFALPEPAAVSTSPAVNVKYIHGAIKNLWGVDIPYSPELKSDQYVVNMRYLLGLVDIANARAWGRLQHHTAQANMPPWARYQKTPQTKQSRH